MQQWNRKGCKLKVNLNKQGAEEGRVVGRNTSKSRIFSLTEEKKLKEKNIWMQSGVTVPNGEHQLYKQELPVVYMGHNHLFKWNNLKVRIGICLSKTGLHKSIFTSDKKTNFNI